MGRFGGGDRTAAWTAAGRGLARGLPGGCRGGGAGRAPAAAMGSKALSGGLGRNIWNPAAFGRVVLLTFPGLRPAPLRAVSGRFLLGYTGGSLGEISSLLLAVGAVYLLIRHLLPPQIAGPALAASFLTGALLPRGDALAILAWGGTSLTACFLAVDPVSSPMGMGLQGIYGAACGVCCTLAAYYAGGVAGACGALLALNLLFRWMERAYN